MSQYRPTSLLPQHLAHTIGINNNNGVTAAVPPDYTNATVAPYGSDVNLASTVAVTTLFLLLCLPGAALNVLLVVAMRCHGGDALRKLEHGLSYNAAAVNAAICVVWMPCHLVRCVASFANPASTPAVAIYLSNCLLFLLACAWLVTLCGMCVQRACRLFVSRAGRHADHLALGLVIASWTVAVGVATLAAVEHRWLLKMDVGGQGRGQGFSLTSSDGAERGKHMSLALVATAALFVLTLIISLALWLASICVRRLPDSASARQGTCGSDDTRETNTTGANGDAALLTAADRDDFEIDADTKVKFHNGSKRRRSSTKETDDVNNENDDVGDSSKPLKSVQLVGGSCRTVKPSTDEDHKDSTAIPVAVTMNNSSNTKTKRTTAVAEVLKQSKKEETDDDDDELDDDAFDMQMRAKMQQSARTGDRRHTVANIGAEAGSFFGRGRGGGGGGSRGGSGSSGSGVFGGLFSSSSGSTKERKPAGRPTNYNYARKFSVDLVALQNQLENPKKLGSMDVFQRPSRSQSDLKAATAAAVTLSEPTPPATAVTTAAAEVTAALTVVKQQEQKREEEPEQEQQLNTQKQRLQQIQQQHHQRACARQQQHRLSETAEEPEDASAADSLPAADEQVSVVPAVSVSVSEPLPPVPSLTLAVTVGMADSCSSDFDLLTAHSNAAALVGSLSTSPLATACGSTEPLAPASSDNSDHKMRTKALFDEHQQIAACCRANAKGGRCSGVDCKEETGDGSRCFSPASKRARKDTRRLQGVTLAVIILLASFLPWLLADFCPASPSTQAALRVVWAALSPFLFVILLARADSRYARAFRKLADAYRHSRCVCYCNIGSTTHPCCDSSSGAKT